MPKALSDTVTVETLLLPVEYDRAAEIALDKISEIANVEIAGINVIVIPLKIPGTESGTI